MFPIIVDCTGQKVAIVGGGPIALHKIENVNRFGIIPHVIAPAIHPAIRLLAEEGKAILHEKKVTWTDIEDAFLIMLVTDNRDVNRRMAERAKAHQKIVVHAEQTDIGNAQIPAVMKRGRLLMSVSTSGASPSLAVKIRNELEKQFDEDYEEYLDFLFDLRQYIKAYVPEREERRRWLKRAADDELLHSPQKREELFNALTCEFPAF